MTLRLGGGDPAAFLRAATAYAGALAAAAFLLHQLAGRHAAFIINKINATAPWGLFSAAGTAACWLLLFHLVDLRRGPAPRLVLLAGENALPAYLLPGLLLAVLEVAARGSGIDPYTRLGEQAATGFVRAAAFSALVVALCAGLRRIGLRVQL
jgi:hypothetical protein